jgi:amino-acid N-acetyltransferase
MLWARRGSAVEPFEEKDFYLEEFRGRSVLIAVAPEMRAARPDLSPLAAAVTELARNDTRVLLWWPAGEPASERRLRAALARARAGTVRRRRLARAALSLVRLDGATLGGSSGEQMRGVLWEMLRREPICLLVVRGPDGAAFPHPAIDLAVALRIAKLVLLHPDGGLLSAAPRRLSFVDRNVLDALLRQGEAEWSGLGDRRSLLAGVRDALAGGVEAVNLCTAEGVGQELFTYEGSGTLFTQADYCHVGPLGVDEFAQAERLLERGQREGLLKFRTPREMAQVLAVAFGAVLRPRHLAGVAGLLTAPYAAERAGEIVGLYTITRFKGEGIGERLVTRLVSEAEQRGLAYVFAVAIDERAQQFFARLGFERVASGDVPAAKWQGYDMRRRARVAIFRRPIAAPAAAAMPA